VPEGRVQPIVEVVGDLPQLSEWAKCLLVDHIFVESKLLFKKDKSATMAASHQLQVHTVAP